MRDPLEVPGDGGAELPQEKLIFGSDGPDADSRVELYKIRLLKLPRDHEAKVLSGNLLRLLPA